MARKGGNPALKTSEYQEKHGFQKRYSWDEPCDKKIYLRVPASMKEKLPDGWQEICRQALANAIEQSNTEEE